MTTHDEYMKGRGTPNPPITGRIIQVGDLLAIGNRPGLIVATTMEQIRDYPHNLAGAAVEIRVVEDPATAPKGQEPTP